VVPTPLITKSTLDARHVSPVYLPTGHF